LLAGCFLCCSVRRVSHAKDMMNKKKGIKYKYSREREREREKFIYLFVRFVRVVRQVNTPDISSFNLEKIK